MSRLPTGNKHRSQKFREEALKPGSGPDEDQVQAHAAQWDHGHHQLPLSEKVTEDITTLITWVLLACMVAKIPDFLKIFAPEEKP